MGASGISRLELDGRTRFSRVGCIALRGHVTAPGDRRHPVIAYPDSRTDNLVLIGGSMRVSIV